MEIMLNDFQEEFRQYVRKVISADAPTDYARQYANNNMELYNKSREKLTELGIFSITIAEEKGGLGLTQLDLIPVMEEFGRSLYPGNITETLAFFVPIVDQLNNEAFKDEMYSLVSEGELEVAIAWYEDGLKYDFTIQSTAEIDGDNVLINGEKSLVASSSKVTHYIVITKDKMGVLQLLLVPKENIQNIKSLSSFDETVDFEKLSFENVSISKDCLLASGEHVEQLVERGLQHLYAAQCAQMVGAMERLLELSVEYAKIREQFGQPIGKYQSIKHKLADMKIKLELARSNSYYVNWAIVSGADDAVAMIYSARALLNEYLLEVASESIQIHGGIGFTEEFDSHLYIKRARVLENYLGSTIQWREKAAQALNWGLGKGEKICN